MYLFLLSPLSVVLHLGTYCCRLQEVRHELLSSVFHFFFFLSLAMSAASSA